MKITGKIILASVLFFVLSLIPNLTKAAGATTCSHLAYDGSRQVAYQTLYTGDVAGLSGIGCGETPIDVYFKGLPEDNRSICFTPNPGFKIDNWGPTESDGKTVCTSLTGHGELNINWTGDGKIYPIRYTYTPESPSDIGTAQPDSCTGGQESRTTCSVNDNYKEEYEVASCPLSSTYICPGHGQKLTSYPQYAGLPNVEFREIPASVPPPSVTVYGQDNAGNEYTDVMRVSPPISQGQKNAKIFWISQSVTSCNCTYDDGSCGDGTSVRAYEPVYATGSHGLGEGEYSLTSTKTFRVMCDY